MASGFLQGEGGQLAVFMPGPLGTRLRLERFVNWMAGVSNLWDLMSDDLKDGADITLIELKCTINAMCLNHSETTPLP